MTINELLAKYFSDSDAQYFVHKIENAQSDKNVSDELEFAVKDSLKLSFGVRNELLKCITFAESKLSPMKSLDFLIDLGKFSIYMGHFELASDIYKKVLNESRKDSRSLIKAGYALLYLGEIAGRKAYSDESKKYLKKAGTIFDEVKDYRGLARCQNMIGTIYAEKGDLKKASEYFDRGLEYLKLKGDPFTRSIILMNIGNILSITGDYDRAFNNYNRVLLKFEQLGNPGKIAELRHNIAMMLYKKGNYDNALDEFDKSLSLSLPTKYLLQINITYVSKAQVYAIIEDDDLAEAFLNKAFYLSHELSDKWSIADLFKIKGIIERHRGELESAEASLLSSLRLNDEIESKMNYAETCIELGLLYRDLNQPDQAADYVRRAEKYFGSVGAKSELNFIKNNFVLK